MINVSKLVERQIAVSDLRKEPEEKTSRSGRYVARDEIAYGPCLMISREFGAGEETILEIVGQRLGWNAFDAGIVDEIAKDAQVLQQLLHSVDEHVHAAWEQTWRELLLDELPDRKYLHHLRQVIMALGHQGNVILVGRAAVYFLPPRCGLRVRVVAPFEARARHVAERERITLQHARLKIRRNDVERSLFIRNTFGKDISSPLNHDLTINTEEISLEGAAKVVLALMEEKLGIKSGDLLEPAEAGNRPSAEHPSRH